jgi:hypothetical protein
MIDLLGLQGRAALFWPSCNMILEDLPEKFVPIVPRPVSVGQGVPVTINHCYPKFVEWHGAEVAFTFGGKNTLEFEGKPLFAELLILRLLEQRGWQGVWVSSFGGKFLTEMPVSWKLENAVPSPSEAKCIPRASDGSLRGCFDVFAWKNDRLLFCEAKRKGCDRLRDSQKRWITTMLESKLPRSDLLVVEWEIENPTRGRRQS